MTKDSFVGKSILLLGGSGHIGSEVKKRLVNEGVGHITTVSRKGGSSSFGLEELACDFSDQIAVDDLLLKLERNHFDIVINCSGSIPLSPFYKIGRSDIEETFQVNVFALLEIMNLVMKSMCRKKFGRVVITCSIAGKVCRPQSSLYGAAKSALLGWTRAIAVEVGGDNVLVNCVSPSTVLSNVALRKLGENKMASLGKRTVVGRLASIHEVADAILFLASPANTYITGQDLIIDGGVSVSIGDLP